MPSSGHPSSAVPSSAQPSSHSSAVASRSSGSRSSGSSSCMCISPAVTCNLLAGFTADYDPSSNKSYERHLHAECRSFLYYVPPMGQTMPTSSYDSADRLLSFQRGLLHHDGQSIDSGLSLPGVDSQRSYNLDGAGNWVDGGWSGSGSAVQFTHDCRPDQESRTTNNLNQVAKVNGVSLSYDAKGNLLGYEGLTFAYDAFDRLISASGTGPNGQATNASYYYDALGRRVRKISSSTTMDFIYDGQQVVEERDGSANLLRQYVWGQYIDDLIQQREYQHPPFGGTSNDLYPLMDLLYRSVALSHDRECGGSSAGPGGGSSGPTSPFVEVYDTDAYGRTRAYNSPGPDGKWFSDDDVRTFTPLCRYIYTGREYDPETGLYYYRARYYHPDLGRFLSRDPLLFDSGDANLYAYCRDNPLVNTDPGGELIFLLTAAAVVLLGSIAATHGANELNANVAAEIHAQNFGRHASGFISGERWVAGGAAAAAIGAGAATGYVTPWLLGLAFGVSSSVGVGASAIALGFTGYAAYQTIAEGAELYQNWGTIDPVVRWEETVGLVGPWIAGGFGGARYGRGNFLEGLRAGRAARIRLTRVSGDELLARVVSLKNKRGEISTREFGLRPGEHGLSLFSLLNQASTEDVISAVGAAGKGGRLAATFAMAEEVRSVGPGLRLIRTIGDTPSEFVNQLHVEARLPYLLQARLRLRGIPTDWAFNRLYSERLAALFRRVP